jgi:siroheme synthase-like protein
MPNSLPINLLVEGRCCIVIGAGAVAGGKVQALESRGAKVTVIAPEVTAEVERLADDGRVVLQRRPYQPGDLAGAFFVVCGTDDRSVNEAVWREAQERGVVVNVVDDPQHCTAIFPAIVKRGDLQIAVSTDGRSPAVAVRVKQQLEREFGEEYAVLLQILGDARPLLAGWKTQADRAKRWYAIVDEGGILDLIRSGRVDEAQKRVREWLSSPSG